MVKRLCVECQQRKAIHWRVGWKRFGVSRDHPLCRRCWQALLDRMRAEGLPDREPEE